MKPQDITADYYGSTRTYRWQPLDPEKADYGASWGLRGPQGTTYLLIAGQPYPDWSHRMIAIGQYSGLYDMESGRGTAELTRDIESILKAHPGNLGIDRKIKKADFDSWVLS
jgi:hypothetical protein